MPPWWVTGLRSKGLSEADLAKVVGGNAAAFSTRCLKTWGLARLKGGGLSGSAPRTTWLRGAGTRTGSESPEIRKLPSVGEKCL